MMNSSLAIVLLGSFVFHMNLFSEFPEANLSNDAANISLIFFSSQCTRALSSEWGSPVGLRLRRNDAVSSREDSLQSCKLSLKGECGCVFSV